MPVLAVAEMKLHVAQETLNGAWTPTNLKAFAWGDIEHALYLLEQMPERTCAARECLQRAANYLKVLMDIDKER